MNPTEAQIASYIDNFRDRIWPNGNMPLRPPRDSEEKLETKERALQLLSSTCMYDIYALNILVHMLILFLHIC